MEKITRNQAARLLLDADDVLILCHRNPDGDTLGSGYALWNVLHNLGKRAAVRCNNEVPRKMRFLTEGYQTETFSPKLVVSVDIASEGLFGEGLADLTGKVDLAIDHHASHQAFAKNRYVEPDSASNCEIMALIFEDMQVEITPQIAACLYTGMATDTGCFKFSNTTPRTHLLAARMMEAGAPYAKINKWVFETKSTGEFAIEREALNNMEIHYDGQLAMITLTQQMYRDCGVDEADVDGIASLPTKLEGVEVAVTIKERGGEEYKISMRSVARVDVSRLCQSLGGGGHVRAAGFTSYGSLEETKTLILGIVGRALEENP